MRRAGLALAGWMLVAAIAGGCGAPAPASGPRQATATATARGTESATGSPQATAAATASGTAASTPAGTPRATASGASSSAAGTGGAATPAGAGTAATASGSAAPAASSSATGTTSAATTASAAGGPEPPAASPASLPAAIVGVDAARFASPATEAASGPALGDVAVVTANHNLHIFLAGKAQPVVPLVGYAAWVPGSDWVIASRLSQPTVQGFTTLGYRVLLAGSRQSPIPLPQCTAGPPQGVLGPAVAFVCGQTLEVAALGTGGLTPPKVYAWTAGVGAARWVVSPDGTLAAAVLAKSCHVRAFKLAAAAAWPGTYTAATPNCPDALAWSPDGTLAVAAFPGVTIWSPGHIATFARDGDFHALLWTAAGLLAISGTPGNGPWADVIAPGGTARAVTAPSAPVLGFTTDGKYAWTAVSFGTHPATYGIAATGA